MEKILVSACLTGEKVRYDGRVIPVRDPRILSWQQQNRLVAVCPEVAGGMAIPRPPAQICGGCGLDVLDEQGAGVFTEKGRDVSRPFIRGAEYALSIARKLSIRLAVLKEKSPSCGVRRIYNGRFDGTLIPGSGVTAELLRQNGILVFSEEELDQVEGALKKLSGAS